jgi:hypothetical protein
MEASVREITFGDHDIDRDAALEATDDDEVGFDEDEEDEDEDEDEEEDEEDETGELMEPSAD